MDLIVGWLQHGFSYIVPFVILLGLLIFVHEMGHFLVAKYYKVKVETFSLGFGKKILSFRRGDTEYCLSLIPLGGYVKMYGDDPSAQIPEDMKSVSYLHKPVSQRIAVVLAGPLMNFFFAILLFFIIGMVGEDMPRSVLGDVPTQTTAYKAGLRSGDEVMAVNGNAIVGWEQLHKVISANMAHPIAFTVKHLGDTGPAEIKTETTLVANDDVLSDDPQVGNVDGMTLLSTASGVALASDQAAAYGIGFRSGDMVVDVNGEKVERWIDMKRAIDKNLDHDQMTFKIQRDSESAKTEKDFQFIVPMKTWAGAANSDQFLNKLGLESTELFVDSVGPKTPAAAAGFQKWDRIVAINADTLTGWTDLVDHVKSFKQGNPAFDVKILRAGHEQIIKVAPEMMSQKNAAGKKEQTFALGIKTALMLAPIPTYLYKASGPVEALGLGVRNTLDWTVKTVMSFVKLIEAKVSPSSIGGPIMIGQIASKTFEVGLSPFLKIMAIISINLFVLNLFPIPVLDGGHLVFYAVEAIRGAPLSMRKVEIAQQVGLVLLMGLMVLAMFNDISRFFK
jgi:regulator of sigma E protease